MSEYTYRPGVPEDVRLLLKPAPWVIMALGLLALSPLTNVSDTSAAFSLGDFLLPYAGLVSLFFLIWVLIASMAGLRIHVGPAGLRITQQPLMLYRYNTAIAVKPFAWHNVQSIHYSETPASGHEAATGVWLHIALMDGSRLKLLTYQHSQNPQVIMPDSDSTPALLDVLRRFSPVPVVHNSEQAAPEKTEDLGRRAEWLAFGSAALFFMALMMMIFSRSYFLDNPMLDRMIGAVGVISALGSAWLVRQTPVKIAIPILALLAGGMTSFFSWSALLVLPQISGTEQQVEFVIIHNDKGEFLESRHHVPMLTFDLTGFSPNRPLNINQPKTLTVQTGPLAIRTIPHADIELVLGP